MTFTHTTGNEDTRLQDARDLACVIDDVIETVGRLDTRIESLITTMLNIQEMLEGTDLDSDTMNQIDKIINEATK